MLKILRGFARITAIMLPVLATAAMAVETPHYLCVVDQAGGLRYDPQTKAWGAQVFAPGRQYIFRRLTNDDRDKVKGKWSVLLQNHPNENWAFFEAGVTDPMPMAVCKGNGSDVEMFACSPVTLEASFEKHSLRFELALRGAYTMQGYWEQLRQKDPQRYNDLLSRKEGMDADHPNDLYFEIGKCSPS
jgi:hypothetical protein